MKCCLLALALLSAPAAARDLPIVLDDGNAQTLVQGLDALWKQQGIGALDNGVAAAIQALYQKLKVAAQTSADSVKPSETQK